MREAGADLQMRPRTGRHQVLGLVLLAGLLAVSAVVNGWLSPRAGVTGAPRLVDGDSMFVGGREVRLEGIDAPEGRQTCMRNGQSWPCGEDARRHLAQLIGNAPVICRGEKSDQHGRLLGTCEAGGRDLNAAMVEDGFAVSYGRYRNEEARAHAARRGLWSGEFDRPRDWRDRH